MRRAVSQAMHAVPRVQFVPEQYSDEATEDHPLPIGFGQTISQPSLVAGMTAALHPHKSFRVLEIGTGSGFQAAVLAQLVHEVFTVEIIPELADSAAQRLATLGYHNVHVRCADGYYGWPEHAPFDGIMVAAAVQPVPDPLIEQLNEGGRIVVPLGTAGQYQELILGHKQSGELRWQHLADVRFVPFVRHSSTEP